MMRPGRVGPLDDPDDDDPDEDAPEGTPGVGRVLAIAFVTSIVTTAAERLITWGVDELRARYGTKKENDDETE